MYTTLLVALIRFFSYWVWWPVKIISLILSRVNHKVGRKRKIPREKPPDHPQAELGLSHMWPEWGLNPQWWDDERIRALKISRLNHSATEAALIRYCSILAQYVFKLCLLQSWHLIRYCSTLAHYAFKLCLLQSRQLIRYHALCLPVYVFELRLLQLRHMIRYCIMLALYVFELCLSQSRQLCRYYACPLCI